MGWILGYLGVGHKCSQLVEKPGRKDISLKRRQVAGCLIFVLEFSFKSVAVVCVLST